jgi:dTDP-glucose pyrophosphorylase
MKIIITMAGEGTRFKKVGYSCPKHEIVVRDRTLFEWSMLSLNDLFTEDFIFIVRKNFYELEILEDLIKSIGIKNYTVHELSEITDGQASTAYFANKYINENDEVLIFNIDTFIEIGAIKKEDFFEVDGLLHVFEAPGEQWSFAQIDKDGKVIKVTEKVRISNLASIGLYYFKSWSLFKNTFLKYKENIKKDYHEVYIAPLYQYIIDKVNVRTKSIPYEKVHILGTPEDLETFKQNITISNN